MKKLFALSVLVLFAGIAHADFNIDATSNLSPSFTSKTSVVTSSITIASPGGNLKTCLTDWSFMSTTVSDMAIIEGALAGGTTMWGLLSVPASTPINKDSSRESALCAGTNSQIVITISSGTASFNYRGYVRRAP